MGRRDTLAKTLVLAAALAGYASHARPGAPWLGTARAEGTSPTTAPAVAPGPPATSAPHRSGALHLEDEAFRAFRQGEYALAWRKARAAFALVPDPGALYVMGKALFACWEFERNCTGTREGDRREALDAFDRYIALAEADPAELARNAEDLDMAKNHMLELQENTPAGAATAALERREKLSLLRRQADAKYVIWQDPAVAKEQRVEARGQALEEYGSIVELVRENPDPSDSLQVAVAEVARKRMLELGGSELPPAPVRETAHAAAAAEVSAAVERSQRESRRAAWLAAAIAVGASALVPAGTGVGLYVWSASDNQAFRAPGGCAPHCDPGLVSDAQRRELVGYALMGVAGAIAIADVVVWAVAGPRLRLPKSVRVSVSPVGASLGGGF